MRILPASLTLLQYLTPRRAADAVLLLFAILLSSCSLLNAPENVVNVNIYADGTNTAFTANPGATVFQTLEGAGIILGSLDRTEPPAYTLVSSDLLIRVIRVNEEFEISQQVIPYQQQLITNESLPSGEKRLIQPGENGLHEITIRKVFEDGVLISTNQVKTGIIKETVPEILMVGVQEPFTTITIPGRLVYLTAGNAWMMDGSTGLRKPVVSTGDLDGRIFSLSADGNWLLFTRQADISIGFINTLWVAGIGENTGDPIDLQVSNVIHSAGFIPGAGRTVAYSTVESRQAAPGWQAENNLQVLEFTTSGEITGQYTLVAPNSGGLYGWWGTLFHWSHDGTQLAYTRPDSLGLVDLTTGILQPLIELNPYQTNSSWAWVPGMDWDPGGQLIYLALHADKGGISAGEDSPFFTLAALDLETAATMPLADAAGMFAYPVVSPSFEGESTRVAYLQAVFPERSDSSPYRLYVVDADGSNRRLLFPEAGSSGLEPQRVVWSPQPLSGEKSIISLVYQGNIWMVDSSSGVSQQITGDGLTSRIDWQ